MDTISPTYMSTFRFSKLIHVQGSHCVVKLEIWSCKVGVFNKEILFQKLFQPPLIAPSKSYGYFYKRYFGFFFGNKTTEHFDLTITKEVQEK